MIVITVMAVMTVMTIQMKTKSSDRGISREHDNSDDYDWMTVMTRMKTKLFVKGTGWDCDDCDDNSDEDETVCQRYRLGL